MPEKKDQAGYLQKASIYELLAACYRYLNLHSHSYSSQNDLKNFNKSLDYMKSKSFFSKKNTVKTAKIRFLHAAKDIHRLYVYINQKPFLKNLPRQFVSDFISIPQGHCNVDLFSSRTHVGAILSESILIEEGKRYTLTAIGEATHLQLLTFDNLPEVPKGETKLRFLNLILNSPALDIAVKDRDIVFPNIPYQHATEYLPLTPMTIDLEVRIGGSKDVVLPLPKLRFLADEAYTIALVGTDKLRTNAIILKD